jgi:hypothetical protein
MSRSTASSKLYRRSIGILLGLGLGLLITGCTLNDSPERALKSAVSVAKFRRVGGAREVMTGAALDAFGTKAGLAAFREKLSKITTLAPAQLVSRDLGDQGSDHYGDIRRVFVTTVTGLTKNGAPASYTAHIACSVDYEVEDTPFSAGVCTPNPADPSGPDECTPDTPASHWEGEVQHCQVSDIAAAAG